MEIISPGYINIRGYDFPITTYCVRIAIFVYDLDKQGVVLYLQLSPCCRAAGSLKRKMQNAAEFVNINLSGLVHNLNRKQAVTTKKNT